MANHDLQLRVPIPHDYLMSYAVQTAVDAECERFSKDLTTFRGYVVSRGFDIENVLSDIISHLLYINRPRYSNETDDEYRFHLQCRGFIRNDLLVDRAFGLRRKIDLARKLLTWIPTSLRLRFDPPNKLLDEAAHWRNCFAHDLIEFTMAEDNSVTARLKQRKGAEVSDVELTHDRLKNVADTLEECYHACCALEQLLRTRYGDARSEPACNSSKVKEAPASDLRA
jgi:hypothetical protein